VIQALRVQLPLTFVEADTNAGSSLICVACLLFGMTRPLFCTALRLAYFLLDLAPDFISATGSPGPTSFFENRRNLATQFLAELAHLAAQLGHFTTKVVP
jgi:hypothetical protein